MKHLLRHPWWWILVFMGIGVGLLVSRYRTHSHRTPAASLGAMLARPVELPQPAVKPFEGKPNRTIPDHVPISKTGDPSFMGPEPEAGAIEDQGLGWKSIPRNRVSAPTPSPVAPKSRGRIRLPGGATTSSGTCSISSGS